VDDTDHNEDEVEEEDEDEEDGRGVLGNISVSLLYFSLSLSSIRAESVSIRIPPLPSALQSGSVPLSSHRQVG
jgi:hypothetical protein